MKLFIGLYVAALGFPEILENSNAGSEAFSNKSTPRVYEVVLMEQVLMECHRNNWDTWECAKRVQEELEAARLEEEAAEDTAEAEASPEVHTGSGELTEGIDTEFEKLVLEMEGARFSSERKTLMEKQTSEFMVNLKIEKMERTLIGDPIYRGGQSVHALIDGGPYVGVIKIPVSYDEKILEHKVGDEIQVWAKLVDFSPSLKRPVLEASEMI